jgi:hypothetical protein
MSSFIRVNPYDLQVIPAYLQAGRVSETGCAKG